MRYTWDYKRPEDGPKWPVETAGKSTFNSAELALASAMKDSVLSKYKFQRIDDNIYNVVDMRQINEPITKFVVRIRTV
jgi:hypothetical protein